MTKDDALRIALNALLGCTYDERMKAIGAVKEALSVADVPAGPAKVRNPRMWAVIKANGQVSKLRGSRCLRCQVVGAFRLVLIGAA